MEDARRNRLDERGQGTVEWVGLLLLVAVLVAALIAAGVKLPAASLARTLAARLVCAISLSDTCANEPELVAAYGEELAALLREHAPGIAYERGMRALPVDFRSCRSSECADGLDEDVASRTASGEPVVAFVHVVDCRDGTAMRTERLDGDCSGDRAGNLYLQYWTYYPDSATLRHVPVVGTRGYHRDDWEGVQFRIGPDGEVDERASSHNGYNCELGAANWGSDAGVGALRDVAEAVGARPQGGWCEASDWLFVSGGSHAGNVRGNVRDIGRITPADRLRLIPLEPIAAGEDGRPADFAISAPWLKDVWRDPEAEGTA
jgi:hypothetical protein